MGVSATLALSQLHTRVLYCTHWGETSIAVIRASDTLLCSYAVPFTKLSFIGLTSYFCAASFHTLLFLLSLRRRKRQEVNEAPWYPLQKWGRVLQALHLWLFSTATTFRVFTPWAPFVSRLTSLSSDSNYSHLVEPAQKSTCFCDSAERSVTFFRSLIIGP